MVLQVLCRHLSDVRVDLFLFMKKYIPSVTQVMRSKHPVLSTLKQRLHNHAELLNLAKQALPESLALQCTGCCQDQSTLIIYSRSAAWVSQLRFYKPVLLEAINKNPKHTISDIIFRVLVTPDGLSPQYSVNQPNRPSSQTIEQIASSARHISDKRLRSSFEKLVQTLRVEK
jgi:hypothetical protein